jgi:hypothetical protein
MASEKNSQRDTESIPAEGIESQRDTESIPAVGIESLRDMLDEHLVCPLTLEMFFEPVLATDGVTYELYALIKFLNKHLPKRQKSSCFSRLPFWYTQPRRKDALKYHKTLYNTIGFFKIESSIPSPVNKKPITGFIPNFTIKSIVEEMIANSSADDSQRPLEEKFIRNFDDDGRTDVRPSERIGTTIHDDQFKLPPIANMDSRVKKLYKSITNWSSSLDAVLNFQSECGTLTSDEFGQLEDALDYYYARISDVASIDLAKNPICFLKFNDESKPNIMDIILRSIPQNLVLKFVEAFVDCWADTNQ